MGKHEKLDGKARVAGRRAAMRAQGYRLKQFWVPDVRSPGFIAEAGRQARLIAATSHEAGPSFHRLGLGLGELPPYDAPLDDHA